jgi:hypothetical protein
VQHGFCTCMPNPPFVDAALHGSASPRNGRLHSAR